ncbi:hypothetical protein [Microbacterium sp. KR10-403]|uniref:hypothetical protein n=1 Tax=Microbacterium sp. KR10-403 TaxID=3158581 RepID=UPI0032E4B8B2
MRSARRHARNLRARVIAVLLILAGGMSGALLIPSAALAADDGDTTVTWSVRPADAHGADGRAWVELALDPGTRVTEHFEISNLGKTTATFALSAADGYLTGTGRFNMLPASQPSTDAGTWIHVRDAITLAAGASAVVPFTVTVPDDALAGDHPAGIAASVVSTRTGADGERVGVVSRVGFRVMTRVNGVVTAAVAATRVTTAYDYSWNPLRPGSLTVRMHVANTGDVAVSLGDVVTGPGHVVTEDAATPTVLYPGDERTVVRELDDVWPLVSVGGEVTLQATPTGPDAPGAEPVTVSFRAWAVPWPQLLVAVGAALIVSALLMNRRRRAAQVRRLVAAAHEEGRRSAQG